MYRCCGCLVRADLSKQLDQYNRERFQSQSNLNPEYLKNLHISLQVVDTALLKCYLQTRPSLVDSLLRLHNNSCFFEDAESILKAENRLPSLFILYESRKKHEMALELLRSQYQDPESDPFFHGFDRIVALELLRSQYQDPESDPFFHGFDRICVLGRCYSRLIVATEVCQTPISRISNECTEKSDGNVN
ncbi:hypothetical protein ANCCEY_07697 [Ancylostoma ceylanicum]|uniref:Vacuolar sorting protein 39/Transforming growth factor beta receptor-associated domain-containing protein n=1 Tax=Ancylostoma ceylanicum TaxID=53326 RepID=A0A0D6LMU4_9BILA|nr:hypothetical protein ANCCEY_07697 [Ancylostoma ceylanicum]